jgi:hypothetical protein
VSGDEFLDIAKQRLCVATPEKMIVTRVVNEFSRRNSCREIAAELDGDLSIFPTVKYKGWNLYRWKNRPDIDLRVQQ